MFNPGDRVLYDGEYRTIVDVVDYTEEEDGGIKDVFYVLRRCDEDPQREVDEEGGDVDLVAARSHECSVV